MELDKLTIEDKLYVLQDEIWTKESTNIQHILIRTYKVWGNMVINNMWLIMFNMQGTPKENWSYREFSWILDASLEEQKEETINYLYDIYLLSNNL